jgi:tRNA(Ile)-lysidine synthase
MSIRESVMAAVTRYGLISHGDRVLVAVSGGPDSTALLHLLHGLQQEFGLHLEVAHLQHGIRGEEAKEDARFVAEMAQSLKLPFHLKEIDLPKMKASAGKGNLEALARAERYRFFTEVARERRLDKVATAHTRDDQAETILMWLLRGSGMKGLGGMTPLQKMRISGIDAADSITVIRPLLDISKQEILDYLAENEFAYRTDRTNQDTALLRNWIRQELLPAMKQRAGDDFPARLGREAELLRDEDRYLDRLASKRLEEIRSAGGLDRTALSREPRPMRRRILRLWIAEKRGHLRGLDFIHIEALLRLIEERLPQGRLTIPGGWELVREYEKLRLEKRARPTRVCYNYPFDPGTTLRIAEAGYELYSEKISSPPWRLPANLMEAVFDAARLAGSLTVRNFRRGDRFQPLGMGGHKKVKELFIEKKVPLSVRSRLPILVMDTEILWIPGYLRSEVARISDDTKDVLHVKAISFTA